MYTSVYISMKLKILLQYVRKCESKQEKIEKETVKYFLQSIVCVLFGQLCCPVQSWYFSQTVFLIRLQQSYCWYLFVFILFQTFVVFCVYYQLLFHVLPEYFDFNSRFFLLFASQICFITSDDGLQEFGTRNCKIKHNPWLYFSSFTRTKIQEQSIIWSD